MEIGHNIGHGQWDWMNDPEIHSRTWEWDMAGVSSQWRYSHNYRHHVFTNVVGMDDDVGFGVMRVTRDEPWRPGNCSSRCGICCWRPLSNGVSPCTGCTPARSLASDAEKKAQTRALIRKIIRQAGKDYLVFPALSRRRWRRTLAADAVANLLRNLWAYVVIFCGHFPDGAEKFTPAVMDSETKPEWYLRQILGTANFDAGPMLAFLSGNLCYQIEHHLFPDLPSNRYAEIAVRVRALCAKYDLPYTTGSLTRQYLLTLRTIHKLALPDRFLTATSDDAPETASERRFGPPTIAGPNPATARRGLRTALTELPFRQPGTRRIPHRPRKTDGYAITDCKNLLSWSRLRSRNPPGASRVGQSDFR